MRKRYPKGTLYARREETENILRELLVLPDDALLARCAIPSPSVVGYVPSECLVYLVRNQHGATLETRELIFGKLAERIKQRLPRRTASEDVPVSLAKSNVADEVFHLLLTMFLSEKQGYDERLDACEVCFDKVLRRRRADAWRMICRREKRMPALEMNESTGEVAEGIQKQGGSVQCNSVRDIDRNVLRMDVDAAIDQLPDLQRQIMHLDRRGYAIYSENPGTPCISKILKKSEKTIHSHHQQAITTITAIVNGEKKP